MNKVSHGKGKVNDIHNSKEETTMKRKTIKPLQKIAMAIGLVCLLLVSGCSEASKVNYNVSKQAEYFECERRITVYNARTDTVIFFAEGYMNISNNDTDELVITCKTGPNTYKKNYVYLNSYTLYAVEDITGTHTDPYHYKWYFHTEILPDIEVKP